MRKKFTPVLDQLLPGLVLLALGIVILCFKTSFLKLTLFLVALLCLVSGFAMLVMLLLRRRELGGRQITLGGALIAIVLGSVMLFVRDLQISFLGFLFALYVLIMGAAKLVNFILFVKNRVKGRITDLFDCLFFLTFGILLTFTPLFSTDDILIIVGVYGIILGSSYLLEFIGSMIPHTTKTRLKRRIRISLPVFVAMLIPHRVLKRMNRYFSANPEERQKLDPQLTQYKEGEVLDSPPDLEVFIHVTEGGSGAMGHCDFWFDGHVISYGNYDEYSRKLFEGAGDGVLFYTSKEKYIPFVTRYSKKTLFGFGFRLTDDQKRNLRKRMETLCESAYRWESPYEADLKKGTEKSLEHYPDYASQLYYYTGAGFYKFGSGRFKSYFVLSTNCVQLVDAALSAAGTAIVKLNGIITPGTYYDYLDDEFIKPGSMVISRTVYSETSESALEIPRETEVRARYRELVGKRKFKKGKKRTGKSKES